MISRDDLPDTPDWQVTPHPAAEFESVFWEDHRRDMLDAEYRRAFLEAEEHIVRGTE